MKNDLTMFKKLSNEQQEAIVRKFVERGLAEGTMTEKEAKDLLANFN